MYFTILSQGQVKKIPALRIAVTPLVTMEVKIQLQKKNYRNALLIIL